ncbi:cell shape-determining protein [Alkalihalobacillus alcalophilus ATCC 27647 = CGMCC 1.3604]|uniref:Cell shape-determining protein n=1 Tax=Alkalihalobacillus alcalophilus ATCC 27647 = CGMCC 1.3604 TaxID=1218173 RepID=A0A094WL66_ALKAL|nr:rod shape-determining protein MreD [Alkalihalobacillus alcalophilus]KGA97606.1 cell shape-determining protein [Alkalihalobacillus alcalophilus ATCC 27647 = CGMCC 1.3604]MED1561393.1 rod shape-determining protein MreD [Alkalihalobacillus alcalophilus]THG92191.1 cell shape-determining protein [Alkalihalobacillus alcalophilus ATCC 27647 = CGMCC 1.3604]
MSRYYLSLLLFFVFIVEGTIFQFITQAIEGQFIVVARFIVVLLVFIGIYLGRSSSIFYGLIFGLLYDVVYTDLLGVYLFGFGLTCYLFSLSFKRVQDSLVLPLLLSVVAVCFIEFYQYGLFLLIDITEMPVSTFLEIRLWPTLIGNLCFAIIMYYPIKKLVAHIVQQSKLRER